MWRDLLSVEKRQLGMGAMDMARWRIFNNFGIFHGIPSAPKLNMDIK
jgi:hypothetical protein